MAVLTGQEIVSDLATRLRSRFSEREFAEIYKDTPVQSMKTPCIFIHTVETTHTPDMGKYAWWDNIIDIRCHPGKMVTNTHSWARIVGPAILDCVERITVSNQQVKIKRAAWRMEQGVLHVTVTYSFRVVQQPEDVPVMETITYGERIKE